MLLMFYYNNIFTLISKWAKVTKPVENKSYSPSTKKYAHFYEKKPERRKYNSKDFFRIKKKKKRFRYLHQKKINLILKVKAKTHVY